MRLRLETSVESTLEEVKLGFNEELFLKLNPPFPPVRLLQFDGCKVGDKVSLELNFLLFKQNWISDITEDYETESEWVFVDVGSKLPFFLSSWTHRHIVVKEGESAKIVDDIQFATGTLLTDLLFYPALFFQFLYRKPIYKRIF